MKYGSVMSDFEKHRGVHIGSYRYNITLPGGNMEVENPLIVEENGLPRGHAMHFHVSSRESTYVHEP